ncbi:MAG: hypothetical protein DLM72_02700 [Candidatus Nitrosopolaris wilkensis]|nr:MAG: hypothetical protein DLM72_02700 [Candidatus Nitrosopolaris wilkensis]
MYLSGWLRKEGIVIRTARKVIQSICEDDEEKAARIRTLEETYRKEWSNDIKGYSGLLELLTDEFGDVRKARTFLDELQRLPEQVQKKDEEDVIVFYGGRDCSELGGTIQISFLSPSGRVTTETPTGNEIMFVKHDIKRMVFLNWTQMHFGNSTLNIKYLKHGSCHFFTAFCLYPSNSQT